MLLFRSEEHVEAWLHQWGQAAGETFSLEQQWSLAKSWYADRLAPDWRRRTTEEAQAIFRGAGLVSDFWALAD